MITKLEHVLTFLSRLPEGDLHTRLHNDVVKLRKRLACVLSVPVLMSVPLSSIQRPFAPSSHLHRR